MFVKLLLVVLLSTLALAAKRKRVERDASSDVFEWEWDLRNVNLSHTVIYSPEFSFQDSNFNIRLEKRDGSTNYDCFLKTVEILSKPDKIHYRFDFVKRLDNSVVKSRQSQREIREFDGWGLLDWIDPASIGDDFLKVKMWKSD
jgi:hypothetical protein